MSGRANLSRLGTFMQEHHIGTSKLAQRAGMSSREVSALRFGSSDPTREQLLAIVDAVQGMIGRRVRIGELFDVPDAAIGPEAS